jgi:hypothetical protein
MRHLIALLLVASACSGDAPHPATPITNASTAGPPTGEVRLHLAGDFPDFKFPLTVTYPGGSDVVADDREHLITVPASADELTRIEIEGWRPIWVRVPIGGTTTLSSHPCCGITFDSNSYDDAIATCAPAGGACPGDRDELHPALAADPLCGDRQRCVPRRIVNVVQARTGGPTTVADEGGPNIADMYTFTAGDVQQDVAMDRATTYTIFLDGDQVTRIRATRW